MTGGLSVPMLAARGVCFSWGTRAVLCDFSLEVPRGSVMCLMGVNGCGKSTFLDCVLGENKPSSGIIEVDGSDVTGMRAAQRARLLAYVPQIHESTFPYTVEHLVLMGRTAWQTGLGSVDDNDRQLTAEALAACGIVHLRDRMCTGLSGGEMQMVLLARALVQSTPIIVLDEPTAHLDFRNELVFLETIERLVCERGVTVLMATHAPNQAFHLEAAGLRVNVALMAAGRVACCGAPAEVLTSDALRRYFGVVAHVTQTCGSDDCPEEAERPSSLDDDGQAFLDAGGSYASLRRMRQIVPLATAAFAPADPSAGGEFSTSKEDGR